MYLCQTCVNLCCMCCAEDRGKGVGTYQELFQVYVNVNTLQGEFRYTPRGHAHQPRKPLAPQGLPLDSTLLVECEKGRTWPGEEGNVLVLPHWYPAPGGDVLVIPECTATSFVVCLSRNSESVNALCTCCLLQILAR